MTTTSSFVHCAIGALAISIGLGSAAMADPGHSHGDGHQARAGHAAALGHPGDPKAQARTVEMVMTDEMRFHPEKITVRRGETIRFVVKNSGEIRHEMVLGTATELREHAKMMALSPEMKHDDPNAITVEPGQTKTLLWTFTKSGQFDFACPIPGHMESGMRGQILVR